MSAVSFEKVTLVNDWELHVTGRQGKDGEVIYSAACVTADGARALLAKYKHVFPNRTDCVDYWTKVVENIVRRQVFT